jgi:tetratricopeptide (TPR) repeat protein
MIRKFSALLISAALVTAAPAFAAPGGGMSGGGMDMPSGPVGPSAQELEAAYNEGVAAIDKQDWKTAVKKFTLVTDNLPKMADAWNYLGYSQRKGGNAKKSEAAYKKALKIDPNHPRANEYYGELLADLNRMPEAEQRLAVLTACCAADPGTKKLTDYIAAAKTAAASGAAKPTPGY